MRAFAKWNKLDRERQILYDLTYKQNLTKTKQKQKTPTKFIGTENRLVVAKSRRAVGGMGKIDEGSQNVQTPR